MTLALVAGLLIASSIASYQRALLLSPPWNGTPTTTTTTVTVTGPGTARTTPTPITTATNSTATRGNQAIASTTNYTSRLGLSLTLNATHLAVGQHLEANVSLFNTLSGINSIRTSDDWLFQGIQMVLWPYCYLTNYDLHYGATPAEAVVLKGDYTMSNISSAADIYFENAECTEASNVDHLVFQPDSSQANLTGIWYGPSSPKNGTLDIVQASNGFVTAGYWDLDNNSKRFSLPILGESNGCISGCLPSSPFAIAFVP